MRQAILERDQLMLTLPGGMTAWQHLPVPVREAVIELLSRLIVEHMRRERTAGKQERTSRGCEEEILTIRSPNST